MKKVMIAAKKEAKAEKKRLEGEEKLEPINIGTGPIQPRSPTKQFAEDVDDLKIKPMVGTGPLQKR